jgi:hypothetical protein
VYNGDDKTSRQLALAAGWTEPVVCPVLFGSNFMIAFLQSDVTEGEY